MNPIGLSSLKWEDSSLFVICVEFSTLVQRIDRNGIDLGKTSLPLRRRERGRVRA
jgi:hypothetical protein